mmetsp:Transcript_70270/g.168376  ORF Transcript_70270/g.168376 Transcript_70270/m.168376 type:complete len:261 (-) Transcript_70270:393-1175(-)
MVKVVSSVLVGGIPHVLELHHECGLQVCKAVAETGNLILSREEVLLHRAEAGAQGHKVSVPLCPLLLDEVAQSSQHLLICSGAVLALIEQGPTQFTEAIKQVGFDHLPLVALLRQSIPNSIALLESRIHLRLHAEHLLLLQCLLSRQLVKLLGEMVHLGGNFLVASNAHLCLVGDIRLQSVNASLQAFAEGRPHHPFLVHLGVDVAHMPFNLQHSLARVSLEVFDFILDQGNLAANCAHLLANQLPLDGQKLCLLLVHGF